MKKFDNIVMSQTEPSTTSLWLKDGQLYYYDGGWKPIGGSSSVSITPTTIIMGIEDSNTLFGDKDVIIPWDTLNADTGSITIGDYLEDGAIPTRDQLSYIDLSNKFGLWITVPGKKEHSFHTFVFSASENKFIDTIMMGKKYDDYVYTFYIDPSIRDLSWTRVPY